MQTIEQLERECEQASDRVAGLYARSSTPMTDSEEKYLKAAKQEHLALKERLTRAKGDASFYAEVDRITGGAPGIGPRRQSASGRHGSLGEQFAGSELYEELKARRSRAGQWTSQTTVELMAATLTEDPASGGSLVIPAYLPGIVPTPQAPIVMSQLFAPGSTDSNAIKYTREKVFTNAAAPTAEGATKPESTLTFEQVTEPVHKIPTWLPVTEELLEDAPGIRSYIDSRLRQGVLLSLDNQLLNGDGVDPNFLGLLVRTDLTAALPVGTMTSVDAIATQIGAVETASQLPVDGIVLNPTDWLKMSLVKTTAGEYIGSNPFETPARPMLFGRAVALTVKMPLGTALVGAFRTGGGQLFQKGGLRVDATNSHADFFIKNLVAIRAEIRAALALYRPQAFGKVTGLNPAP